MPYRDLAQDAHSLRRIFLALGLAAPDEDVQGVALTGGVSSGIYRVDLRSGAWCVKQALPQLKVAKEWKVPVERVFSEIGYLETVAAIAPGRVPRVVGTDTETCSFVMPFLGPAYRNWKADLLEGRVDVATAQSVGDVLGRIHAATAGDQVLAAKFATDANFHAIRLEPYLVETSRMHPELADRLLALVDRTATTQRVLVHGDVSPKNILVGPEGPVLLDAECAWYGDPAFDVAFCLNHFLLKAAHLPAHVDALVSSFAAFRRAYFAHAAWEPAAELEARVATLLPGLTLARIDGKSPVEYLDEASRDTVRRLAVKLLRSATVSLEVIAAGWAWELMS